MTWAGTYSETFLLALDEWASAVFFGRLGLTISTLCRLVKEDKHGPLKLADWQIRFLRWLEPRLSEAHCTAALASDLARSKLNVTLLS